DNGTLLALLSFRFHFEEANHDPQTEIRRVPSLLPQGEPQHRQASQPRDLPHSRRRRKTRTRRPVFQTPLTLERGDSSPLTPGPCVVTGPHATGTVRALSAKSGNQLRRPKPMPSPASRNPSSHGAAAPRSG